MSIAAIHRGLIKQAIALLPYETDVNALHIATAEAADSKLARAVLAQFPCITPSRELFSAIFAGEDELVYDLFLTAAYIGTSMYTGARVPITQADTGLLPLGHAARCVLALLRCQHVGWYTIDFDIRSLVEDAVLLDDPDLLCLAQPEDIPELRQLARDEFAIECLERLG